MFVAESVATIGFTIGLGRGVHTAYHQYSAENKHIKLISKSDYFNYLRGRNYFCLKKGMLMGSGLGCVFGLSGVIVTYMSEFIVRNNIVSSGDTK